MNIRLFDSDKDFKLLKDWSRIGTGYELTIDMIPDTTYLIEKDDKSIASACLFLTNCKSCCIVENVLSDMTVEKSIKREAVSMLFNFLESEARDKGYTMLLILASKPKVINRYKELGFRETLTNLSSLVKEIK